MLARSNSLIQQFKYCLGSMRHPVSMRGSSSLLEALPISVRGTAYICERPYHFCVRPCLLVRSPPFCEKLGLFPAFLGLAQLFCKKPHSEMPGHSAKGRSSLWEASPLCERPVLSLRGRSSLSDAWHRNERHAIYMRVNKHNQFSK